MSLASGAQRPSTAAFLDDLPPGAGTLRHVRKGERGVLVTFARTWMEKEIDPETGIEEEVPVMKSRLRCRPDRRLADKGCRANHEQAWSCAGQRRVTVGPMLE